MNLDPGWMFASMIFSTIGSGIAFYGYKQRDTPTALFGVALILSCFFVQTVGALILVDLLLCALFAVVKKRMG